MLKRLVQRATATAGLLTGPATQPERYRLIEEISRPNKNHPSVYLGRAPYAWTAVDTQTQEIVVVKIHDYSLYGQTWEREALALWRVTGYPTYQHGRLPLLPSPHPGQDRCINLVESFQLPTEDGEYDVIESQRELTNEGVVVLPLLGPSLRDWQQNRPSPWFPTLLGRRLAHQVLLALDFLHTGLGEGTTLRSPHRRVSREGLTHAAVTLDNLLLCDPYTPNELHEDKPVSSLSIKLCGFSSSTWASHEHDSLLRAGDFSAMAPEQILDAEDWGPCSSTDIWAVGTLVSWLIFNRDLAMYYRDTIRVRGLHALASLYPDEPWPETLSYGYYCSDDPFENGSITPPLPPLRQRMETEGKVTKPDEFEQLYSFLKACWTLDPKVRPSAKDLLEHEWLRGVE